MDRKLAAILAADVVGYSALMERDEKGTFERLKALRLRLLEPSVKGHHGRVFKLMGDGFLIEFGSVVDAIACALALQRAVGEAERDAAPESRIVLRMGVHLGDVIVEGRDRHGEGVNLAARLQQLAEPGGIAVSQAAYDQAKNKFAFEPRGQRRVKNIAEPIAVYGVKRDGVPSTREGRAPARWPWAAAAALILALAAGGYWFQQGATPARAKPGLAVMPFASFTAGERGERLATGSPRTSSPIFPASRIWT
jgi:class 3 adenylate cyclase